MLSCNATKRTQSIPQLSHNILCSYRNSEYRLFSNFWRFNEIAVGGCVRYKRWLWSSNWGCTPLRRSWSLRNECRNSTPMTRHYQDLGSASDWLKQISLTAQPIRGTSQIWVMIHHQYWISAPVSQTSFGGKPAPASQNVGCLVRLSIPSMKLSKMLKIPSHRNLLFPMLSFFKSSQVHVYDS